LAGQPVTLSGSVSGVAAGATVQYTWSFGDGGTGAGPVVTHTYATAGTFPVTLLVSTSTGQSGTASTTVTVTSQSGQQLIVSAGGLYTGAVGQAITFVGSASGLAAGAQVLYTWSFGDGSSAS